LILFETVDDREDCGLQSNPMRFRSFFPLVFLLLTLWSIGTKAQGASSAESYFKEGLAAFQKGDDKGARASFQEALKLEPENPVALFNLGLTESRAGNKGLALALWRKALAAKPDFEPPARAIEWTREKLEHSEISHEVELWESFRTSALVSVPLGKYLLATAILLLVAGWLSLRYVGLRRQARLDEKPMPPFPTTAVFSGILFVVMVFLGVSKAYDDSMLRGTLIVKKIEARSAPDAQATPLFDLYEGLEVLVKTRADAWTQVTYPGGSTGWIPSSALLATNESANRQLEKPKERAEQ
jgi:hypothetical protein